MFCALCAFRPCRHQRNTVFIPDFFVLASLIADILFVRDVGKRQTWKEEQRSDETSNTHRQPPRVHSHLLRSIQVRAARTNTNWWTSVVVGVEWKMRLLNHANPSLLRCGHQLLQATDWLAVILSWLVYIIFYLTRIFRFCYISHFIFIFSRTNNAPRKFY